MGNLRDLSRKELLSLPKSINSYIILREYVETEKADFLIYFKLISEYIDDMPSWELLRIISSSRIFLGYTEWNTLIQQLFAAKECRIAELCRLYDEKG